MISDVDSTQLRSVLGGCAVTLLVFPSMTLVFGVSPIITVTILLSFLIVLLTAGGCALHLREISRLQEAEALETMNEKAEHHLRLVDEVIGSTRERLAQCERLILKRPGVLDGELKNVAAARRLMSALEERAARLAGLLADPTESNLLEAIEIVDSKLVVSTAATDAVIDADPLPELESHLWRDTIDMLLLQSEKQLREKADLAA